MSITVQVVPGLSINDVIVRYHGNQISPATASTIQAGWAPKDSWQNLAGRLIRGWLGYSGYGPSTPNFAWAAEDNEASWGSAITLTGGGKGRFETPSQPRVRLEAIDAKVVSISEQTTLIDHAIWDNRHGLEPRHFDSSVHQDATESVGSAWEKSQTVGVSAEVGVEIGGVGAKTSVSYETSWGESHSVERSVALGTSDSISGDVGPGELQLAALVAKRGTLLVDVTYRFEALDGHILAHTRGHRDGYTTGQTVRVDLPGHSGYETEWIGVPFREAIRVWYGRPYIVNKQRLSVGFFADEDLSSYPLTDNTPDAIDKACGAQTKPVILYSN